MEGGTEGEREGGREKKKGGKDRSRPGLCTFRLGTSRKRIQDSANTTIASTIKSLKNSQVIRATLHILQLIKKKNHYGNRPKIYCNS